MKNILSSLFLFFLCNTTFAQNFTGIPGIFSSNNNSTMNNAQFRCFVRGITGPNIRPVKKGKLNTANLLSDFCKNYPSSWLQDYVSTEIKVTTKGKETKASGVDGILTTEQQKILRASDINSKILIDVRYKSKNVVTNEIEIRKMLFSVTVVPEEDAKFPAGEEALNTLLKKNVIEKISEVDSKKIESCTILFTINEEGQAENIKMFETSGNATIDIKLLEVIKEMPKWTAAKNAKGVKVKQNFEFSAGMLLGC